MSIEQKIIQYLANPATEQDILIHLDYRPVEIYRAIEALKQRGDLETVQAGDLKKLRLKTRKAPKK